MPHPESSPAVPRDVRSIRYVSLLAGTAGAMYGEFELAVQTGMHPAVALSYPVALDLYAYAAFRLGKKADVALALGLMSVSQALSHLIGSHVLSVNWLIVVLVWAVILPLVLWRTHHIGTVPTKQGEPVERVEPVAEASQDTPEEEPEEEEMDAPALPADELAARRRWSQAEAHAHIVKRMAEDPALRTTEGKDRLGREMGFKSGARRVNQILANGPAA